MGVIASALVAVRVTGTRAVEDAHHAPAPAAACQTRQQRPSAPGGLALGALLHVRVLAQQGLVLLELGPGQIAFVMVANEGVPGRPFAAVTGRLRARPSTTLVRLPRRPNV